MALFIGGHCLSDWKIPAKSFTEISSAITTARSFLYKFLITIAYQISNSVLIRYEELALRPITIDHQLVGLKGERG
jgi:uncharacterized membrane protein